MLKGSLLFSVLFLLFLSLNLSSQNLITNRDNTNSWLLEKVEARYKNHPEYGVYSLDIPVENVELIQLRTETSKTFLGSDGQYRIQQTGGVFHYKNNQGEWITIQSEISKKGNDYGIFNSELPIKINVTSGLTEMTLKKSGETYQFGKNVSIQYVNSNKEVIRDIRNTFGTWAATDNEIFLKGGFNNIERYQRVNYWGVRTDYIIHDQLNLPAETKYVQFSDKVFLPKGWKIVYNEGQMLEYGWQGNLVIKDESGQVVSEVSLPKYYDSKDRETSLDIEGGHAAIGAYLLKQESDYYTISLIIQTDWLNNPDLVYPLIIDPTTTNTYANNQGVEDKNNGFQTACQATMNLSFPPTGMYRVTGTNTSYTIWSKGYVGSTGSTQVYADKVEQRSRVGSLNGWTTTQSGTGTNHASTNPSYYTIANNSINYNLTNQTIANGCYKDRATIPYYWQGYQTFLPYGAGGAQMNLTGCRTDYQELVTNTWVVTATYVLVDENYTVTPTTQTVCSGNSTGISMSGTNATFSWTVSQSGVSGGTSGSGTNITQVLSGNGTAIYTVTPSLNGCSVTPTNVVVTVNPSPTVTVTNHLPTLCQAASTNITIAAPSGVIVNWTVSTTGSVSGAMPGSGTSITQALSGSGTVTYNIYASQNGCSSAPITTTVLLQAGGSPIAGPDEICVGTTTPYSSGTPTTTGPVVTNVQGDSIIHTFNGSGTFVVPTGLPSFNARVLVVAGGGGGTHSNWGGSGGGGGGVIHHPAYPISAGTITVIVGNGGGVASPGGHSFFGPMQAFGGGPANTDGPISSQANNAAVNVAVGTSPNIQSTTNTRSGGSGGGAGHMCFAGVGSTSTQTSNNGGTGYGNMGGNGQYINKDGTGGFTHGSGGGAGSAGSENGLGGNGISFNISGSNVFYGAGGGKAGGGTGGSGHGTWARWTSGGGSTGTGNGNGGGGVSLHGAGNGGQGDVNGGSGVPNRGGGGGGASGSGRAAGSGGSGVVIVKYKANWTWTSSNPAVATVDNSGNITAVAPGTTIITYNDPSGCTFTKTITVKPSPSGTNTTSSICTGATANVNLASTPSGSTFSWTVTQSGVSGGSNGSGTSINQILTRSANPGTATYTITPTLNGCVGNPFTHTVTVNTGVGLSATLAQNPICSGGSSGITVAPSSGSTAINYSYTVSQSGATGATTGSGTTTGSINQTLTASNSTSPGTVTYTITRTGGCTTPAVVTLTVNPIPVMTATPVNSTICSGTAATINLTSSVSGTTYTYTTSATGGAVAPGGGSVTGSSLSQVLMATGSGGTVTYTFTPSIGPCMGTPVSVTINVNSVVTFNVSPKAICSGSSVNLGVTSTPTGAAFEWFAAQTNASGATAGAGVTSGQITDVLTATGTSSGSVVYTIMQAGVSCSAPVSATITVNRTPIVTATVANNDICSGTATGITLTSNVAGTTFNWTVTPTNVSGASGGSGSSINQTLTSNPANAVGQVVYTITPTVGLCPGNPVIVTVNVHPSFTYTLTPSKSTICSGETTDIVVTSNPSGASFVWTATGSGTTGFNNGGGTATSSIQETIGTTIGGTVTYTITSDVSTCATSANTTINVSPTPDVVITPQIEDICSGGQTTGSISSGYGGSVTYSWTYSTINITGASAGSGNIIHQTLTNPTSTTEQVVYTIIPQLGMCAGNPEVYTVNVNPIPSQPVVSTTPATCSAVGSAQITGYNNTLFTYTITPAGATISSTGAITGAGGPYTVRATVITSACYADSDPFTIDDQLPASPAPTIACYETATFNTTTCAWDVTGTQPVQPTTACYETATFNTTTCAWDVTGTQPVQPTTACYETATFNTTTCVWDVTGTQPVQPTTACYETATFNTTTCVWDVTGTQPVQPTTACYETATFNTTTCVWDVTGTQPVQPTTACYETATFNTTTCVWDVTGTQPVQPTTACYETATFNTTTCAWDVTGTQPVQPTTACYETATFNTTTCVWDVTGTQPVQPTTACYETATFNTTTCVWDVTGTQPVQPTTACYETATFNTTTCVWDVTGTQPVQPTTACYETATFNTTTCVWDVTGTQPVQPTTACYETATFNTTTCVWDVTGTQPVQPTTACYETATFNTTTCAWDVTGTQPVQPTTACYETATFNTTTCVWDVTGTQPVQPTTACYETATFNTTTCVWDVTGTQPVQPTTACYETATFNTTTCVWDVTGTQPVQPTTACYETATFNTTTCVWDVTGTQPVQPTTACYETATFNTTTCVWDVTGTQPVQPTTACYETATFNTTTCVWDVTGTQPVQPTTACYETATFNTTTCVWDVTGTQPVQPTTACYETATFNTTTCAWDVTGTQPVQPTTACYETATFNTTTCAWDVTGTQPVQPTTACYETATFNTTTCVWDVTGTQPVQPTTACYETATFNTTTCVWDVTGTQPVQPTTACYETATFNTTTCVWDVTGTQPVQPTTACYETATFNTTTCAWDVTGTQPVQPTTACYETATFNTATCAWDVTGTQPVQPTTACYETATFNTTTCAWVVSVTSLSTASISGSTTVCQQGTSPVVTFTGSGGTAPYTFTYTINGGAVQTVTSTGNTATVSVPTATAGTFTYALTGVSESSVTACSNPATGSVSIVVNPKPVVTLNAAAASICSGSGVSITPASTPTGATFSWTAANNNTSGANSGTGTIIAENLTATTTAAGTATYTVTGTLNGCTSDPANSVITVNPMPVASAQGQTICSGTSTNLALNSNIPGTTFSWTVAPSGVSGASNGSGSSINQMLTSLTGGSVTYTITPTAGNCSATPPISVVVDVQAMPAIAVTPANSSICQGDQVTLTATGGVTYTWTPSIGLSATTGATVTATPSATTTYIVTGASSAGCTGTSQTVVTVNNYPNVTISSDIPVSPNVTVCLGTPVTLTASGAATYTWSPVTGLTSASGAVVTANPSTTTTYTVSATSNGCTSTESVTITVNPIPVVSAGPDITVCKGSKVILNATGAVSYSWSDGVTNLVPFTADTTRTYTVTGTSEHGCTNTDYITVFVTEAPEVAFTAGRITGCVPLHIQFENLSQGATSYAWSFGDGTTSTLEDAFHDYEQNGCFDVTLTAYNTYGCSTAVKMDSMICTLPSPTAAFVASTYEITNVINEVQFNNMSEGATSYQWYFGDETGYSTKEHPKYTYDPNIFRNYNVMLVATNQDGCTDTARVVIRMSEDVVFYVPNSFTPDGDNFNNVFKPVFVEGFDAFEYDMLIFNRWGEVIFETHNINYGWDGTYLFNGGKLCPDGTYVWKINVKKTGVDDRVEKTGHVTLVR